MPEFDASLNERMAAHLEAQKSVLVESWNQAFEVTAQLQPGALAVLDPSALAESLKQPGLAVVFEEGDTGAVVLIPVPCGLPAWYRTPTDTQKARLNTLAMEWALNLWPDDHMMTRSETIAVADLTEYLNKSHPATDASLITVEVRDAEGAALGAISVIWPVAQRIWEVQEAPSSEPSEATPTSSPAPAPVDSPVAPAPTAAAESAGPPASPPPVRRGPDPLARLRKLPVMVSVRVAEKKISVSQLLAITPGALVTFNKPCDDLLDLYVNNSLYCRGEAVKIGESFGLKIDHVGVHVERETRLLQR